MTEQDFSPKPETRRRRRPYQIGQIVEQPFSKPKGKIPKDTKWIAHRVNPEKNHVESWQLISTLPEVPTHDQLPPQKPPEVIREEIKNAQIEDWHKRTDI